MVNISTGSQAPGIKSRYAQSVTRCLSTLSNNLSRTFSQPPHHIPYARNASPFPSILLSSSSSLSSFWAGAFNTAVYSRLLIIHPSPTRQSPSFRAPSFRVCNFCLFFSSFVPASCLALAVSVAVASAQIQIRIRHHQHLVGLALLQLLVVSVQTLEELLAPPPTPEEVCSEEPTTLQPLDSVRRCLSSNFSTAY